MDDSLRIRIFDKEFKQYINPDDGWPITPQGKPLPKGTKTWER